MTTGGRGGRPEGQEVPNTRNARLHIQDGRRRFGPSHARKIMKKRRTQDECLRTAVRRQAGNRGIRRFQNRVRRIIDESEPKGIRMRSGLDRGHGRRPATSRIHPAEWPGRLHLHHSTRRRSWYCRRQGPRRPRAICQVQRAGFAAFLKDACQASGKLLMIQDRARRYGAKVAPDAAREMGGQAGGCVPTRVSGPDCPGMV